MTNRPAPALRRVLLVDAATSGAMGVLLLLGAGPIGRALDLPVGLLRWCSIILIPFAGLLVWVARAAGAPRGAIPAIVVGNALWAIGSVLLLAGGWLRPTMLGEAFVLIQALVVAAFAYAEYAAWRRGGEQRARAAATAGEGLGR